MCQKGGVPSKVLLTVTVKSDFLIVRFRLSTLICCCLDTGCWFTVWFAGSIAAHCWFVCLGGLWCLCLVIRWRGRPVVGLLCRYVTREKNCCVFNDGLRGSDYFVWDRCRQVVAHALYICGRDYRRGPC